MKICQNISELKRYLKTNQDKTIGFVPTMGNFHAGHESLFQRSVNDNDLTIVSSFVNPTQFNQVEDYKTYPNTSEDDQLKAKATKVNVLFMPSYEDLYPADFCYQTSESRLSQLLEAAYRPGHFRGVLTVVLKLLQLIRPTKAYFGEKDYQQLALIKGLVKAFFIEAEIVACPTIRSSAGLALSSRNNLLTDTQLKQAELFPKLLQSNLSNKEIIEQLNLNGLMVDYVEDYEDRRYGAVKIGNVRLIDNFALSSLEEVHKTDTQEINQRIVC